ncbi:hypothetical protein [Nonomuraea recticatena]|uniref:Uncharacterized protein n=1 Tax=Nonomuraea recticatena TaxID=46178 RepID=A0ABN3S2M0_9ACTN
MSLLEQRYRFVLRMLPASYRAEREEEMVDAFLDAAGDVRDEDNLRPGLPEVASVAGLAVRTRIGGLGAPPRARATGDAVRLFALLGLGHHAALAWDSLAARLAAFGLVGSEPDYVYSGAGQWVWALLSVAQGLVWAAAFAMLALARVRPAKVLAVTGLAASVLMYAVLGMMTPETLDWSLLAFLFATALPVVALLTAYHADAPPVRPSVPLTAAPLGVAVLYQALALTVGPRVADSPVETMGWLAPWLDPQGVAIAALLVAGMVCLTRRAHPSLLLALAIAAVPMIVLRAPFDYLGAQGAWVQAMALTMFAQAAVLAVLAVALTVAAMRALPRVEGVPGVGQGRSA